MSLSSVSVIANSLRLRKRDSVKEGASLSHPEGILHLLGRLGRGDFDRQIGAVLKLVHDLPEQLLQRLGCFEPGAVARHRQPAINRDVILAVLDLEIAKR